MAHLAVNGGSQHPDKRKAGGHTPTLADQVEHLLPTPRPQTGGGGAAPDPPSRVRSPENPSGHSPNLMTVVSLLPTPTSRDGKGPNQRGDTSCLHGALLPTPTARTQDRSQEEAERRHMPGRAMGRGGGASPDLASVAVLLPTPRATDGMKGGPNQRGSSGDLMLPSAVMELLPTPTAADGDRESLAYPRGNATLKGALLPTLSATNSHGNHKRGGDRAQELLLPGIAKQIGEEQLLPTPRAQDAKHAETSQNELAREPGKDLLHVRLARQASSGEPTSPPSAAGKPSSDGQHHAQLSLDEPASD